MQPLPSAKDRLKAHTQAQYLPLIVQQIGKASARKSAKHLGYVRRWQYLCNVVLSAVVHKVV